jgi:Amidohydrolase
MTFGADRLLFSVDYPFGNNLAAVAFLKHLPVSPDDREKIAYKNAVALLCLGPRQYRRCPNQRNATRGPIVLKVYAPCDPQPYAWLRRALRTLAFVQRAACLRGLLAFAGNRAPHAAGFKGRNP